MTDPMPGGNAVTADAVTAEDADVAVRVLLDFPRSFFGSRHAA
jgi:hypothetical protein